MNNNYREIIIQLLQELDNSYGCLFAELLNLASLGEMKDVLGVFEEGDTYEFKIEHFDDLKDPNIQKLLVLLKSIDKTFEELKQDNNILSEEIFPNNPHVE